MCASAGCVVFLLPIFLRTQINDLDEDNLLDISQEEVEDREDDRWSEYQSIKISLDPLQRHLLDRLTDTSSLRAEFKVWETTVI